MALELELDFSTTGVLNVLDADGNTVNAIHLGQVTRGGQNNGDLLITNSVFLTRSDTHEVTIDSSDGKQYKLDIRDIATPTYATTQDLVDAIVTAIGAMYAGGGGSGTVTSVGASGGTTGFGFSGSPVTGSGTLTLTGPYVPPSWVAILSQNGTTDAPVANVLQNELGGTIVWARSDTGTYTGTLTGAFTVGKTWVQPVLYGLLWGNEWSARIYPDNANTINLLVTDFEGNLTDGFEYLAIEIRVYPA